MVDDALRAELSAAAVAAAKAIDYVGAGTVEFLADAERRHASGSWRPTPGCRSSTRSPSASPAWTWSPSSCGSRRGSGCPPPRRSRAAPRSRCGCTPRTRRRAGAPTGGTVRRFAVPGVRAEFDVPRPAGHPAGRRASSTARRSATSYDPMLAKVIAWAPTRAEAAARLAAALAGAQVHGLTTNRDLLVRTLRHPDFLAGRTDTAFFDRIGLDTLAAPLAGPGEVELAALAAALADGRRPPARRPGAGGAARAGGGTSRPSRSGRRSRSPGRPSRSATGTPGTGCWSRAATTSSWCRRRRTRSCWRSPASSTDSRTFGADGADGGRRGGRLGGGAAGAAPLPGRRGAASRRDRWSRRCPARCRGARGRSATR